MRAGWRCWRAGAARTARRGRRSSADARGSALNSGASSAYTGAGAVPGTRRLRQGAAAGGGGGGGVCVLHGLSVARRAGKASTVKINVFWQNSKKSLRPMDTCTMPWHYNGMSAMKKDCVNAPVERRQPAPSTVSRCKSEHPGVFGATGSTRLSGRPRIRECDAPCAERTKSRISCAKRSLLVGST